MPPRLSISSARAIAALVLVLWCSFFHPDESRAKPTTTDYYVQSWQTDEGLPGNQVKDMLQDPQGFLWLATIGGLVRFDGVAFKVFTSPLVSHVAARNIRALAQTADGTLLMLPAIGGVVEFKGGEFRRHPVGDGLAGLQFESLFVDGGGAIWLGMYGCESRRWQDGRLTDFPAAKGVSRRAVVSFATDREGGVWIASGGFLGCYRDGQLTMRLEENSPVASLVVTSSRSGGVWIGEGTSLLKMEGGQISAISTNLPWAGLGGIVQKLFEDSSGALWIGTSDHGVFRFADGKFAAVETSQSQINSIMEDREGDIWVATAGGGINRLRPKYFRVFNARAGLAEDVSDAVCADARGDVYLANRGSGVVRVRGEQVRALGLQAGPRKLRAYSVGADDHGWIWGSEDVLFRFPWDHPEQVQIVSNNVTGDLYGIHVLFKSREGDLWLGADPNLLACFRGGRPENYFKATNYPGQRPRAITEDVLGGIWIGTEDRQLMRLVDGKFTTFTPQDGLPDAPIRSLCADQDGSVWIGTIGGGLGLWRHGKFTVISAADGLPDNDIAELVADDAGALWCGSRGGIFRVAKADVLAFADGNRPKVHGITFGRSEGLAGVSCVGTSQPMAAKTADGRLWFATRQGILSVDSAVVKFNARPPPVFIDELSVNDHPLVITEPMRVPPLCNKIEFRFSALSFAAPEKVRLRYKLDGVDSDWAEIAGQRTAVYSALRPGTYRLHLTACNDDGVWNETGAELSFLVRPAWWQSWWFQGTVLAVFMTVSALGIRHWSQRRLKLKLERLEHQQALARERSRIARDLHDDLGATVTQVGLMLEELRVAPASAEEIRRQSSVISGRVLSLARDLDAVVWSVNPGNDTLGELLAYLGQSFLECFRRTPIRPRLEVADAVPEAEVAPEVRHHIFLVVKEALNNVVKHSQADEVTLNLKVVENLLEIRINDNGRGFSPEAIARSTRHGFPNMRARVEQVGGTLEVTTEPGKGTSLLVVVPSWRDLRAEPRRPE